MNSNIKCLLAFTVGAAVGVAASWKYMELKYRKIADEEIESVKEVFSAKPVKEDIEEADDEDETDEVETNIDISEPISKAFEVESMKAALTEYNRILETENYHNNYNTINKEGETSGELRVDAPYMIDSSEVGDCDYEVIELTYYEGDDTLADEFDELVDDVEDTVGIANLGMLQEIDSICVRNDARKVDFEILADVRSYEDVMYLRQYE